MFDLHFHDSKPFTLGVEVELQILDNQNFDLCPAAPRILDRVPDTFKEKIKQELLQSMIEVLTGVCASVDEVEDDLGLGIRTAQELATRDDCFLFASSLHPFARAAEQKIMADERYERIMKELQIVGRRFITQGLHVHVGITDRQTAILVCDAMQPYLSLLLALTGSSPYFQSEDTGFCSYRTKLFESLPLAGLSEFLGDWKTYVNTVQELYDYKIIRHIRDVWWDIRPHPDFGTVEIRICDLPSRFREISAMTAVVQALVALLAEGAVKPTRINNQVLRYNKWQAARHGLDGTFVDPLGLLTTEAVTMRQGVLLLLERIEPYLNSFNTLGKIPIIEKILDQGTSSTRQRQLYKKSQNFKMMITHIHGEFWS